ncbi:hypothetical protein HD596_001765 [Nonomuraea jabiensis]|uniref:Uncharacterized protein n=1 Tax=Nonomuraea jabiensis TaxID=882448 RepID=A0A7W9G0K2_9ACTN|nr:hypothetical protein [Nonomuraea jabiensis]
MAAFLRVEVPYASARLSQRASSAPTSLQIE